MVQQSSRHYVTPKDVMNNSKSDKDNPPSFILFSSLSVNTDIMIVDEGTADFKDKFHLMQRQVLVSRSKNIRPKPHTQI